MGCERYAYVPLWWCKEQLMTTNTAAMAPPSYEPVVILRRRHPVCAGCGERHHPNPKGAALSRHRVALWNRPA